MFLDLQLRLLFPYRFCPGDHVFYAFVEVRADDASGQETAALSATFCISAASSTPPSAFVP